jgi:hypothetical protein
LTRFDSIAISAPDPSFSSASDPPEQIIHDEIDVQPPPKLVKLAFSVAQTSQAYRQAMNENPTYEEAIHGPKRKHWIKAMQDEIEGIRQNETWQLAELPPGRKTIGVKWVLAVKRNAKGEITKYKARLVA